MFRGALLIILYLGLLAFVNFIIFIIIQRMFMDGLLITLIIN